MSIGSAFRKVEKRAVADEIIEQLLTLIRSGKLKSGDRLPSEMDLMAAFGVGRSSVREALKALEYTGVIEKTTGGAVVSGTFPSTPMSYLLSADKVVRSLQVAKLYEARRILEVELAVLALPNVGEDDIIEMRELCDAMENLNTSSMDEYMKLDRRLHQAICNLSGNPLLARMWEISYDMFIDMRLSVPVSEDFLRTSNERHRLLVNALAESDAQKLRDTVSGSLALGEEDLAREFAHKSTRETVGQHD